MKMPECGITAYEGPVLAGKKEEFRSDIHTSCMMYVQNANLGNILIRTLRKREDFLSEQRRSLSDESRALGHGRKGTERFPSAPHTGSGKHEHSNYTQVGGNFLSSLEKF
jgi:hypothetical protein